MKTIKPVWCAIFISLLVWTQKANGQDYAIKRLKLFHDRDEVLIKNVTRDQQGFIWFLTNGEIYRYDGFRSVDILRSVAQTPIAKDMPQRILIDHKNRLWVVGNASLGYLDLKTWKTHTVPPEVLPPVQDRTANAIVELTDSTLVVSYENGHLLLIKNEQYSRIDYLNTHNKKSSPKRTPLSATFWKNKIWIGTSGAGLLSVDMRYQGNTMFRQLPGSNSEVRNLISNQDTLIIDVPESINMRVEEGVLTQLKPKSFAIPKDKDYLIKEGRSSHAYADDASLYLLNATFHLHQQLTIPSRKRFRTTSINISGDEIVLGREDGIFVAYPQTKGVSRLVPVHTGPNKSVRGIHVYPDGALFYGTYGGAGYVDPHGKVFAFPDLRHAYALFPMNDNRLLVGTEGGFLKVFNRKERRMESLHYTLSDNVRRKYATNLPSHVMCLSETPTDYLIGGMNGLWLLNKKSFLLDRYELKTGTPRALDLQIRHIQRLHNERLLLSSNLGLFELSQGVLTKKYPESGNMGVFKSIEVDGTLWIATQGDGLVAMDSTGKVLEHLTTSDGLSSNLIFSLECMNNIMIAGTADGLNLIDNQQRIRRIGMAEGVGQSEFNSGASSVDYPGKRVYIGGLSGYTILDMRQDLFKNSDRLESYVTEIHTWASNTNQKTIDYTWPYRAVPQLSLNQHQSLTGLYVGTPYNYRANSTVSYALNTGNWGPLSEGQFISLIEPSPGRYDLKLRTLSTGTEGRERKIALVKHPHYYQTWWFRGMLLVSFLALTVVWYRNRIAKILREQEIRNRIAADLHDEVGSSLTRIFFQASSLVGHQEIAQTQVKQLELIARTSKQALLTMSDMVWSIDSRFDTTHELVIRMKDYVYRLREELDFKYRFTALGDIDTGKVSQAVRQNLLLIYKEALTNAIKYGNGSEIDISLQVGVTVRLVITNGHPINPVSMGNRQGGYGIENMKLRAAKVDGRIYITDANQVFQVVFELPPQRGI